MGRIFGSFLGHFDENSNVSPDTRDFWGSSENFGEVWDKLGHGLGIAERNSGRVFGNFILSFR